MFNSKFYNKILRVKLKLAIIIIKSRTFVTTFKVKYT